MHVAGKIALTAIALLGIALVPQRPVAAETPLTGEQVRTLIAGNTVTGPYGGRPFEFSYEPGGRVYGTIGPSTGNGSWRVRENASYCHEWSTFFDGTERCYRWYDMGNGRYRMVNVDSFRDRNLEVWSVRPGLD